MTRVVVTGASGFVGGHVCRRLAASGAQVIAGVRESRVVAATAGAVMTPESSLEHLTEALKGAESVVHLAAAVHDVHGRTTEAEYWRVNRDYPLLLARAAVAAHVERFVFVSTIKVNGEGTSGNAAYSEDSPVAPQGPYADSKWQAEQSLVALSAASGLQMRIVRPPLVYGPGVRANFQSLLRWVQRGVPLPFGSLHNARSLVYVENLADLLARLALGPASDASSRTYLVSDGADLSTPELVRGIAAALGVAPRLVPVPEFLLRNVLSALGRGELVDRLLGSLRVDSSLVRREVGWSPPFSVAEGLARTATWFKGLKT
ncbi:MAG: NAD-dependent epimerase/dehydratase family protein [Vicinamibacterales bacterium]